VDAFHERLARTGLAAAARFGFGLAGGYAVQAAGLLEPLSEDVDLFTAWERRGHFEVAVTAVVDGHLADGLGVEIQRRSDMFARLQVSDGENTSKVELGLDWRANEAIDMSVGPVLHPDDAVANKMSALYRRARSPAIIDIDAALRSGRYDRETLLSLTERADSGLDRRTFADAIGQAQILDVDDFGEYGLDGQDLDDLRGRFTAWRTELLNRT